MYSLKRLHISDLSSSVSNKPKCFNCGILCHFTHATPKGQMCGTCHQYFQRTGNVRPTAAPMRRGGGGKTLTQQLLQPVSFNSPVHHFQAVREGAVTARHAQQCSRQPETIQTSLPGVCTSTTTTSSAWLQVMCDNRTNRLL